MRGRHSLGNGFYLIVRHDHNLDLQNASGTSANHNTNTNTQVEDRQIRYYITCCRSYFCIFSVYIQHTKSTCRMASENGEPANQILIDFISLT